MRTGQPVIWTDMGIFSNRLKRERDAALATIAAMEQQPRLVSIVRSGRNMTLTFMRNGELTQVLTYLTLATTFDEIEERLLG